MHSNRRLSSLLLVLATQPIDSVYHPPPGASSFRIHGHRYLSEVGRLHPMSRYYSSQTLLRPNQQRHSSFCYKGSMGMVERCTTARKSHFRTCALQESRRASSNYGIAGAYHVLLNHGRRSFPTVWFVNVQTSNDSPCPRDYMSSSFGFVVKVCSLRAQAASRRVW